MDIKGIVEYSAGSNDKIEIIGVEGGQTKKIVITKPKEKLDCKHLKDIVGRKTGLKDVDIKIPKHIIEVIDRKE